MGENRLMQDLYEENQKLKARVAELEAKHWNECRQIARYDDELRKAKELLKAAVEDFNILGIELDSNCELCGFRQTKMTSAKRGEQFKRLDRRNKNG